MKSQIAVRLTDWIEIEKVEEGCVQIRFSDGSKAWYNPADRIELTFEYKVNT